MSQPIHVFVVAPVMLCWGFERLINTASPCIRMSGSAPSLATALAAQPREPVDVLVVDHDEEHGFEALARAAEKFPVLLLTSGEAQGALDQLRTSGVAIAVRKRDDPSMLLHAIRGAWEMKARGERWSHPRPPGDDAAPAPSGQDPEQSRIDSLTCREGQLILVLMRNPSASGKVLADRLCISEHTLRNHLTSIYAKLGLHSRLSLHAYATTCQLEHRLRLKSVDVWTGRGGLNGSETEPSAAAPHDVIFQA